MKKDFELEVILTITTGINCSDDYNKIYDLVRFVYNYPYINAVYFKLIYKSLKEYIFNLYPYLMEVNYCGNLGIKVSEWLTEQKKKFGNFLPISQLCYSLNDSNDMIRKRTK